MLLFSHSVVSDYLQLMDCSMPGFPVFQPSPGACSNSFPLSQWCHPTISSSVTHLSACSQSFPESESFPVSRLCSSGRQSTETSASVSVLPVNVQGWFPLGLTGLIALQSKVLLRVFSSTTIESINSSAPSLLYGPTSISVHDYWKNHSFDYMNVCWQSDVSAF